MVINVATLFPNMISGAFQESIIKRAIDSKILELNLYNYRDYTTNKHRKVDDTPYGGGSGMLMQVEPVLNTIRQINSLTENNHIIYLTPKGSTFNQKKAVEFSKFESLTILCGHYEGFDQRIIDNYIDEEISIGDFVMTGGEPAAVCIIDAVVRLLPSVLSAGSTFEESFTSNLLEYPQYTKPESFEGHFVPKILLSGNHGEIAKWRKAKAIEITKERRPDLYEQYLQNGGDR